MNEKLSPENEIGDYEVRPGIESVEFVDQDQAVLGIRQADTGALEYFRVPTKPLVDPLELTPR
jgi:hypothetical protein